jgi:peptidoglycan hydrolase-like protein with peptidoglycan-binding domain
MKSVLKNRFFLTIAMLLAVVGGIIFLNSPQASALSGCTQIGTRTVTFTNERGQVISMGTYPYYQTLRYGNKNSCVASLQKMANVYCTPGTRLAVDGEFGPKTYHAIKSIQQAIGYGWYYPVQVNGSNIIVDGVAGPQTWSILQAFSYWGGNISC